MRSGTRSKKVKVWVRIRPSQNFASDVIHIDEESSSLELHLGGGSDPKKFANNQKSDWAFKTDGIFLNASQQQVYDTIGADLINSGLAGVNGTIMCYGQTGAGKTFTITGATEMFHNRGLVPRALSHLYKEIEAKSDLAVTVRITYLEIYNDTMVDLLASAPDSQEVSHPLTISEENGGIYVKGLNLHLAQSEEEALNLLFEGETNRATATHALNKNSSRSHTIFTIYLESRSRFQSSAKYSVSKINFVDLAGSERLEKTRSTGKTMQEASYINKSLSFLEQTVIALAERNRDHVPYRQSKLTHYLKDSIGGTCKTILIANIWGDFSQIDETVSTMRFAQRMSCVASEPIENQRHDPNIMIRTLENEVVELKKELAMHSTLHNKSDLNYEPITEHQRNELYCSVEKYINKEIDEIDLVSVRQIKEIFEIFRHFCCAAREETRNAQLQHTNSQQSASDDGLRSQSLVHSSGQIGTEAVGTLDGKNYSIAAKSGVGVDESGVLGQSRKKESRKSRQTTGSPVAESRIADQATSSSPSRVLDNAESSPRDAALVDAKKPSTPPSRSTAFDDFKKELGSEIYRILCENKDTMKKKRENYSKLATLVNATKIEIDRSRLRLDAHRAEREKQGNMFTPEGELIISEEEFVEIKKLRQLKSSYKCDFDALKELKTQIYYCQKMVDLTRQRLMQEFDNWFSESFLDGDRTKEHRNESNGHDHGFSNSRYEDPIERFRLSKKQQFSQEDYDAYSRAKEYVEYKQVQQRALHQEHGVRRKPGTLVVQQKNQPPSQMDITDSQL